MAKRGALTMDKFIIQQKNEKAYKTVSTIEPTECSKLSTSANLLSTNANKSSQKTKKTGCKKYFQNFSKNRVQTVDKGKIIVYNMFTKDMNKVNTT